MGQPIHDSSLCDRAKRCINNKPDCSSSRNNRKRVHLSNGNQGPPVDGSTSSTAPSQGGIYQADPDLSPNSAHFPVSRYQSEGTATNYPSGYTFVPITDAQRQAAANHPSGYMFVPIPDDHDQDVDDESVTTQPPANIFVHAAAVENQRPSVDGTTDPTAPNQDVANLTAPDQAIANSHQVVTFAQINQAAEDQALVNEFATVLAIATQIPLHQAAAVRRPVRFTVNQSMAPSPENLFLQILTTGEEQHDVLRRWETLEYAHIRINEISFTLGDDSNNQPTAPNEIGPLLSDQAAADQALINQAIISLAANVYSTITANQYYQVTAGFFVLLYTRMFQVGGFRRETVRRWIQSGNARLPANIAVSRLPAVSGENPNDTQIAARQNMTFRAAEAIENAFQRRIQPERQPRSLLQQEPPNDSSLRQSLEGSGAPEGLSDEDHDSDATIPYSGNRYPRVSATAIMAAYMLRNRYSRNRRSRRRVDGASSDEGRRMAMEARGRRNALQLETDTLSPGNNTTATYSRPPDVENSQMFQR